MNLRLQYASLRGLRWLLYFETMSAADSRKIFYSKGFIPNIRLEMFYYQKFILKDFVALRTYPLHSSYVEMLKSSAADFSVPRRCGIFLLLPITLIDQLALVKFLGLQ